MSFKKISGKIRLFVMKPEALDGFEVLNYNIFYDGLESIGVKNGILTTSQAIQEEIHGIGFDGIDSDIRNILKNHEEEVVIEIFGDYVIEYQSYNTVNGTEYDSESHLLNVVHTKLSDEQVEIFTGMIRNSDGLFELKKDIN